MEQHSYCHGGPRIDRYRRGSDADPYSLDVDYVLVVFGGFTGYSSDDVNKFLWPVRIGSGVFPNDMPHEKDFYKNGRFSVGSEGSPALHNCLLYQLAYNQFREIPSSNGVTGFDRARNEEIRKKDIHLTHFEEAYTSAHWIVRVYKVKKPSHVTPASSLKRARVTDAKAAVAVPSLPDTEFLGCVVSEDGFGGAKLSPTCEVVIIV